MPTGDMSRWAVCPSWGVPAGTAVRLRAAAAPAPCFSGEMGAQISLCSRPAHKMSPKTGFIALIPPHTQNGFIDNQVCKYCFRYTFVFEPRNTNLSPISPEKHGAAAAAARGRTAVPAGTPQEEHTAHLDISPVGMAQADPRGGTKGPGRPL